MKHALLALVLATPAAADCLTAANLTTGIAFQREDGRSGLARAEGKDLRIDYSTNADSWNDTRLTRFGVYDLSANFSFNELPVVGGGSPQYDWTYSARLSEPSPGKRVTSKVTQKRFEDIGTEFTPPAKVTTYQATYSFQAPIEATFSGCTYKIIPVEAAYSDGTTQRYLYFPDLGLGLETRTRGLERANGERRGLTALKAAP